MDYTNIVHNLPITDVFQVALDIFVPMFNYSVYCIPTLIFLSWKSIIFIQTFFLWMTFIRLDQDILHDCVHTVSNFIHILPMVNFPPKALYTHSDFDLENDEGLSFHGRFMPSVMKTKSSFWN